MGCPSVPSSNGSSSNARQATVRAVKQRLEAWGITEKKLPKNMTGKLQIVDLVVNGPYKARIRRKRISALFEYMQNWKVRRLQEMAKAPEERELPPFKPPKPDLYTGLRNSFEVERDLFAQVSFKDAIKKTFVAAGQTPRPDPAPSLSTRRTRAAAFPLSCCQRAK